MKSVPETAANNRCEIWLKSAGYSVADPSERWLELEAPNQSIHIGRASKRHPSRGCPARHNALYNSAVVSRDHGRIYFENEKVFMLDTSSTHGTFVNGQRLLPEEPKRLLIGDHVTLGSNVKTNTGQDHISVDFEVSFAFRKMASGPLDPNKQDIQADEEADPAILYPNNTCIEIFADEEVNDYETSVRPVPSSKIAMQTTQVFCVPSDSENVSEESESDWYERFELHKIHMRSPSQGACSSEPDRTTTPRSAPKSPRAWSGFSATQSVSPMKDTLAGRAPLPEAQLPGKPVALVEHDKRQGIKPSVLFDCSKPVEHVTSLEIVSSPSRPQLSGIANSINSSRERLSIPNLLATPSAGLQDGPSLPPPNVRYASVDDTRNCVNKNVENGDALGTVSTNFIPTHREGNPEQQTCGLKDGVPHNRKRHLDFTEEMEEGLSQTMMTSGPQWSRQYPQISSDERMSSQKRFCFDTGPTSASSGYYTQVQNREHALYNHGSISNTTSFVVGTIIGSLSMLGGLIALPDSLFS